MRAILRIFQTRWFIRSTVRVERLDSMHYDPASIDLRQELNSIIREYSIRFRLESHCLRRLLITLYSGTFDGLSENRHFHFHKLDAIRRGHGTSNLLVRKISEQRIGLDI